jgi:putative pyruvate formate lyase activating enzyme
MGSQARQFESLKIWESFRNRLPWYFEVSTNHMPAKYLIAKCIPCNLDLSSATEGELWNENSLLAQAFLDMWEKVRVREISVLPPKAERSTLMDLSVELANRMLAHCNFCRWNCKVDRSKRTGHGTCQLESTSKIGSYFHHRGEELIFRGTSGSGTIFFTSCNMRCSFCQNGDISTDKDNGIQMP